MAEDRAGPPAALAALSDGAWLTALKASLYDPVVDGVRLPGFPPAVLQNQFVGSDGERALEEAFAFYRLTKQALRRHSSRLRPGDRVLDFGCGWGRVLRFFIKDLAPGDLSGVDPLPDAIELCRAHGVPGNLSLICDMPPTELPRESFKLVYAFSVFSHLPEDVAAAWIRELSSMLAPGGLLVATSRGPWFIDYAASLHGRPDDQLSDHELRLRELLGDVAGIRARYEAGQHVFVELPAPTVGLARERYGEAFVPEPHIREVWGRWLEPVSFEPTPADLLQSVIVMRKPGGGRGTLLRQLAQRRGAV